MPRCALENSQTHLCVLITAVFVSYKKVKVGISMKETLKVR